jgi:Uma2 family endonuclease
VPEDIYERLIRLSAAETVRRQETVSVPALIVEIVSQKLASLEPAG